MRFIVKQRILSLTDSFVIYDENNQPAYEVKGKLFSFGDQLKMYGINNGEQIDIEQKIFKFLPEYHFYQQRRRIAVVKKEFTFFKPRFNIESEFGIYTVDGNLLGYHFQILKDGMVVARVDKEFFSFRDTYSVEILSREDQGFLLAICIVIDQTLHDRNHNNH